MEHMILWAICSLMALLILFWMDSRRTKPDEDAQELDPSVDPKIAGKFLGMVLACIFLGTPMWGFFELVYWLFT